MTVWKHPNIRRMHALRYRSRTSGWCAIVMRFDPSLPCRLRERQSPLKQHASVISACPERQRPYHPTPQSTSFSHTGDYILQRGDSVECPLGVCQCQCGEARHVLPAALRQMHDVVTCSGVDGGSIKPPDE